MADHPSTLKKPKPVEKKIEAPKTHEIKAATTIAVLAAQATRENELGPKRTTKEK